MLINKNKTMSCDECKSVCRANNCIYKKIKSCITISVYESSNTIKSNQKL